MCVRHARTPPPTPPRARAFYCTPPLGKIRVGKKLSPTSPSLASIARLVHYPHMSQPPAPYDRSWSFTNFSQSNPTTPHQGQKIDQELNNARTAINATISRLGEIQADDGKIRTTALNLPVIAEEVEPLLTDGPVQAVNAAGAVQIGLVNAAGVSGVASLNAVLTSQNALDAIAARDDAETARDVAEASAILAHGYSDTAQGYTTTALQAKNSAIVHAQVAQGAAQAAQASAASIPLIVGPVGPQGQQGIQGIQGIQGVIGNTGPAGAAGQQWVYRGAYNGGITYAPNDYVTFDGSSYVMINFIGAGGYSPTGYPGSWQLIASKGATGDSGTGPYLPLAGGTMTGQIDINSGNPTTSNLSEGSLGFTDSASGNSWLDATSLGFNSTVGSVSLQVCDGVNGGLYMVDNNGGEMRFNANGITFGDNTVQTTAATAAPTNNSQFGTTVNEDSNNNIDIDDASYNRNTIHKLTASSGQVDIFFTGNSFTAGDQVLFINLTASSQLYFQSATDTLISPFGFWCQGYGAVVAAIYIGSNQWILSGKLQASS